ncbi:MAG: hypothetical protein KME63_13320 [Candidatus Thiodiazotropha sp. (ex Clathrolucina costata)]|nr:hypothetical protein [Candidatus Thiodiazotropha taylori]MBT3041081.1 hypothetical protein [Candidatus Thiodiazotropha sp. (ex Codakia orbicularis)]MBT3056862.1 hypothetical protein [Candidatus Thiodiazotropha sp. (ex Codakia orbicularis)]MBV2127256.1 hypothetical protein [Candidatus Thiodiazotropha taylori]
MVGIQIPNSKRIVCITGSVWTGSRSAPRRLLVKEGFVRPTWFTTSRRITDANYRRTSLSNFHLANASKKVISHTKFGGSIVGIMQEDFNAAMEASKQGVLIVGPPEIAAQVAGKISEAVIFSLKDKQMDVSTCLDQAIQSGQLHRINVNVLEPGAWTKVYRSIMETMGLKLPHWMD